MAVEARSGIFRVAVRWFMLWLLGLSLVVLGCGNDGPRSQAASGGAGASGGSGAGGARSGEAGAGTASHGPTSGGTSSGGASGGSGPMGIAGNTSGAQGGDGGSGQLCNSATTCLYFSEDFEKDCAAGWALNGIWICREPETVKAAARSGANVLSSWGKETGAPTYVGVATSPVIDLSLAGQPLLEFYSSMDTTRIGNAYRSGLRVRVRVGETVFELPHADPIYTGNGMWSETSWNFSRHRLDLSEFSGKLISLEFEFTSASGPSEYVQLDDITIYDASLIPATTESPAVPRCSRDAKRCKERLAQVCSMSGTWQTAEECPFVCVDGSCGGVCRPYEASCDAGDPKTRLVCASSGLERLPQSCAEGCGEGRCRGVYMDEGFDGASAPPNWLLTGDWAVGQVTFDKIFVLAAEGGNCLGTGFMGAHGANREYAENFAQTPWIDLSAATAPVLEFLTYLYSEPQKDGFNVWVRSVAGADFELLSPESPPYDGSIKGVEAWSGLKSFSFHRFEADLSRFVGKRIQLRFALASDGANQHRGVFIERASVRDTTLVPLEIELPSQPDLQAFPGTPFKYTLRATGGSSRARWSIVDAQNADWLSLDATTGVLFGMPDEANVGVARFIARIEEPGVSKSAELEVQVEVRSVTYRADFDASCPEGWTLNGDWQCGTPTNVGPAMCFTGSGCIATVLDGNYHPSLESHAISPPIDLSDLIFPRLEFAMWSASGPSDVLSVRVSVDDGPFTKIMEYSSAASSAGTWLNYPLDLFCYAGTRITLDFVFRSNETVSLPGVYLDHFVLSDVPPLSPQKCHCTPGKLPACAEWECKLCRDARSLGELK